MTQSTPAYALDLFEDVRHLHPNLRLSGRPSSSLTGIRIELVRYLLDLLGGRPHSAPEATPAEWDELLAVLKSHWVLPLLYWQAGHVSKVMQPPEPVMAQLRETFQWNRSRTLSMDQQLQELSTAFRDAGIRYVILKGPAFGRMVYPDVATRAGSDLDMLVHPDDMLRSRELLLKLDYRCLAKIFGTTEEEFNRHEDFVSKRTDRQYRAIELHWRLHSFDIGQEPGIDDLLSRAVQVTSGGFSFYALDPVDALIHRALNNAFIHDCDLRLIWVYDILMLAQSLRSPEDWVELQKRCVIWHARQALELAFILARSWYGFVLPEPFADFSRWPSPSPQEVSAWDRITQRVRRIDRMIGIYLFSGRSCVHRLWLIVRLIVPSRALVLARYPVAHPWLFPLAYIRRWRNWLGKYLP